MNLLLGSLVALAIIFTVRGLGKKVNKYILPEHDLAVWFEFGLAMILLGFVALALSIVQ